MCACTLYLFDYYNYTLTFAVQVCMFVTEKTLVRPDKAATQHVCCLCIFQMYSEAIHCIHNNGSESLLHDLSSFSVCLSLAQTHAIFFSPLLILLVYTLCIILWASVLHFFTCISCVGHILCVVSKVWLCNRGGRCVYSILLHYARYIVLAIVAGLLYSNRH